MTVANIVHRCRKHYFFEILSPENGPFLNTLYTFGDDDFLDLTINTPRAEHKKPCG